MVRRGPGADRHPRRGASRVRRRHHRPPAGREPVRDGGGGRRAGLPGARRPRLPRPRRQLPRRAGRRSADRRAAPAGAERRRRAAGGRRRRRGPVAGHRGRARRARRPQRRCPAGRCRSAQDRAHRRTDPLRDGRRHRPDRLPTGAPTVHLARADAFPDALAAGVLTDGPIVLVPRSGAVPAAVLAGVDQLAPRRVVALGGPGAVSDAVLGAVAHGTPTGRLAGADRFATAARISAAAFPNAGPHRLPHPGRRLPRRSRRRCADRRTRPAGAVLRRSPRVGDDGAAPAAGHDRRRARRDQRRLRRAAAGRRRRQCRRGCPRGDGRPLPAVEERRSNRCRSGVC